MVMNLVNRIIGWSQYFKINPKLSVSGTGNPYTFTWPQMEAGSLYVLDKFVGDGFVGTPTNLHNSTTWPVSGINHTPTAGIKFSYRLTVSKAGYESAISSVIKTR
jgi:hypothetical protein